MAVVASSIPQKIHQNLTFQGLQKVAKHLPCQYFVGPCYFMDSTKPIWERSRAMLDCLTPVFLLPGEGGRGPKSSAQTIFWFWQPQKCNWSNWFHHFGGTYAKANKIFEICGKIVVSKSALICLLWCCLQGVNLILKMAKNG